MHTVIKKEVMSRCRTFIQVPRKRAMGHGYPPRAGTIDDVLARVVSQLQYNADTCSDRQIVHMHHRTSVDPILRQNFDRLTPRCIPSFGLNSVPFTHGMLSLTSAFSCRPPRLCYSRVFHVDSAIGLDDKTSENTYSVEPK